MLGQPQPYLINLKNLDDQDFELVGRESIQNSFLHKQKIPTPSSFVVTSKAFDDYLIAAQLVEPIMKNISEVNLNNYPEISRNIQKLIIETKIPSIIERPLIEAYKNLGSTPAMPFVSMEISNVINSEFLPNSHHHHFALNIYGVNQFVEELKRCWAELFSVEATRIRLEKNYVGILTTAVIVQRMIRPEISGSVFSKDKDSKKFIYVNAIYGLEDEKKNEINAKDVYKVAIENMEIAERNIVQQTEMIVRKGKSKEGEDPNMVVKISPEWQSGQKLEDERIIKLAELTLKINEYLNKNIELSWGIEAGEINIFNIHDSTTTSKPNLPTSVIEYKSSKIATQSELENNINNENLEQPTELPKNLIEDIVPPLASSEEAREEIINELKTISLPEESVQSKINLLTQIYIDTGSMTSDALFETGKWKRSYLNGNDLILNNQQLPEKAKTKSEILNYISNLSLQINNISRLLDGGELIYSLSSINSYTLKLLAEDDSSVKGFYDERFINNEEALLIEISAIKKSRNEARHKNISLNLSGIRNYSNLMKIKRIISSEGLRRSPSFKMFAELSIPSFAFDIDQIDSDDVDGIIIDLDGFIKNSTLKTTLLEKDYLSTIEQLKKVKQIAKEKKLTLGVRLESELSNNVFKEVILLQPTILIASFKLNDNHIQLIKDTEKEFFENMLVPLNKRGRKIKKLF